MNMDNLRSYTHLMSLHLWKRRTLLRTFQLSPLNKAKLFVSVSDELLFEFSFTIIFLKENFPSTSSTYDAHAHKVIDLERSHESPHDYVRQQWIAAHDAVREHSAQAFRVPVPPLTALGSSAHSVSRSYRPMRPPSANTIAAAQSLLMLARQTFATQAAPVSAVQGWLDSVPVDVSVPPALSVSRQSSVVSHNSKQDTLPLGAEAATVRSVRPSHHSRSSQRTLVTNMVNVPVGIIDVTKNLTQNLFELANAQRQDAIQREAAILHLANSHREDATQREQSIREENAKIRNENAAREQKIREENVTREENAKVREKILKGNTWPFSVKNYKLKLTFRDKNSLLRQVLKIRKTTSWLCKTGMNLPRLKSIGNVKWPKRKPTEK